MNRIQVWTLAARPKTLVAGIAPVLIGTTLALCQGRFNLSIFLFTLLTALGIQIGTNLANDYFDFIKGADTAERKGFTRMTQAGFVTPAAMKRAMITTFAITLLSGGYLIWHGGALIAILLSLSVALGVLYTGGPFPLAYLGLGEFFVLFFFGPIAVLGTYFLQTGTYCLEAFIAGLSPGALSMAILIVNNVRDIEEDKKANKKTLAVRFGKIFGRCEFLFAILLSLIPPALFFSTHPFSCLTLLILLPAIPLMRAMVTNEDPKLLNSLFSKTA